MTTRRRADLVTAFSGIAGIQADFDTPMPEAALDTAWPVTSDSYPNVSQQLDRILDCSQQDLVSKEVIRRLVKFDFDYDADPVLMAIHLAYIMGVAGAPTGSPANEAQRLTRDVAVSAGTVRFGIVVGSITKYTPFIPWNVSAANLKTALENINFVGRGNTTVSFNAIAGAVKAIAILHTTGIGTIGQQIVVGGKTYTVSADGLGANEISVGSSANDFADKIAARVNTDTATTTCLAVAVLGVVTLTANTAGTAGNATLLSTTDTNVTIDNGFQGGAAAVTVPYWTVTFVNNHANDNIGNIVVDNANLTGGVVTQSTVTQGVQRDHALTRITGFQPPAYGMAVGFRTSDKLMRLFKSSVADTFRATGSHAQPRVTVNWGMIASAEVSNVSGAYVPPDCQVYRPARFRDCGLIIDGVDYALNNLLRDFEVSYSNGIITDDDAYTAQDEDIHRAERADQRVLTINAGILGEHGDVIHDLAESLGEVPVSMRIGRTGNCIVFNIPKGSVSLRDPVLAYDGTAKRSKVNVTIEPELIPGDATTPFTVDGFVGIASTLLGVA